jgi:hypothetical protein
VRPRNLAWPVVALGTVALGYAIFAANKTPPPRYLPAGSRFIQTADGLIEVYDHPIDWDAWSKHRETLVARGGEAGGAAAASIWIRQIVRMPDGAHVQWSLVSNQIPDRKIPINPNMEGAVVAHRPPRSPFAWLRRWWPF